MTRYTPNMTHAEYIAALNDELRELQARAKTSTCLLYTSPSPRDVEESRMPSSA